ELRVGADRPEQHKLVDSNQPAVLEHVGTHEQVGVPEPRGGSPVRADPPGEGGDVEDELGRDLPKEPRGVRLARKVVVDAAGHDDLVSGRLEPLDHVRAEEPRAACDERLHGAGAGAAAAAGLSQSTRPSQRSRLFAYHSIVLRTPSSHETCGSQLVSRASFSYPTRSAMTPLA